MAWLRPTMGAAQKSVATLSRPPGHAPRSACIASTPRECGIAVLAMTAAFSEIPSCCAGMKVLADRGNAVDSAVATALCQGVLNPMASGLGGGGFMVIQTAQGETKVIDAREVAPAAASEHMFAGDDAGNLCMHNLEHGSSISSSPQDLL